MRNPLVITAALCLAGLSLSCSAEQPTEPSAVATAPSFNMGGNSPTVEFEAVFEHMSFTLSLPPERCRAEITGVTPEDFKRTNPDGTFYYHVNDATADMVVEQDGVTYSGTGKWTGIFYYGFFGSQPMDPPPPRVNWQWRNNVVGWVTDGEVWKHARCWLVQTGRGRWVTWGIELQ